MEFSARESYPPPPPLEQLGVFPTQSKIKTGNGNVSECPLRVTMIVISFSV